MSVAVMKHLSEILTYEVKNPDIGFITITGVDVTPDASIAKVFVTFLGSKDIDKNLNALERTKGFLRTQLSKRLGTRIVPELHFVLDKSFDEGQKIESILKTLKKEEEED
jgi:ribosome-binding factor A